jgi:hypothetical protein
MKHWIASGCLLAAIGTCTLASAQNPFVGTWKLNQAKSQLTGDTVKYSPASDGAIRETTAIDSYTFKPDGKSYNTAFQTTARWKRVSDSLWVVRYRRNTILLDTDTMRISPDGKTMTISSTGTTPDGKVFHRVAVYVRVDGTKGLMGTWKSDKVKDSTSEVLKFEANGPDGVIWILPAIKAKLDMKFDGKDYAPVGPTVPKGLTISATKTGDKSFEMVEKMDGKPLYKGTYTVSDDGKTLTNVSTPTSTDQEETAVYDKE